MHSRLFQVEDHPVEKDDYYSEWRYIEDGTGFVYTVADWISEVEDDEEREDSIKWLESSLKDVAVRDGDKFTIVNKIKYFENQYKDYQKVLDMAKSVTLEQFSGIQDIKWDGQDIGIMTLSYRLSNAIENKYGFYVDDGAYCTLDEYMRYMKDGDVFYIGAVFDYHY